MIEIIKHNDQLLLRYTTGRNNDVTWVDEKLKYGGKVTFRRIFTFDSAALVKNEDSDLWSEDERVFVLGIVDGDFYRVNRDILGLKHDLLLSKNTPLSDNTFVANRDISIFRKINDLVDEPIVVGGELDSSIPLSDFEKLLQNFPTSTELTHYANARITRTLKDYFGTMSDAQISLDAYLNRKRTIRAASRVKLLQQYEPRKFKYVHDELLGMIEDAEAYTEKDWQKLILNFLLLIFPKYIAVLENLRIKDFYSKPPKSTNRYIDLTLVDASGTIDIIEIKKPFANSLLSTRKYRDNYTPREELAGSVMQVEKYMFHLNKWGRDGEREILKKRRGELPPDFEIRITKPKAMIILGRDNDFADDQKFDFEIIRRKYANIIDIMTYDDLIRRLDNIIFMLKQNNSKLGAVLK